MEYIEDGEHSVLFYIHITGDLERAADYITYISYGELFYSGGKDECQNRGFETVCTPRKKLITKKPRLPPGLFRFL